MTLNYNIIHLDTDFYIASAISRSLQKRGILCNLSAITDNKTPDPFNHFSKENITIVCLNGDMLFRTKLAEQIDHAKKRGFKVSFLETGDYKIHSTSPWNAAIEGSQSISGINCSGKIIIESLIKLSDELQGTEQLNENIIEAEVKKHQDHDYIQGLTINRDNSFNVSSFEKSMPSDTQDIDINYKFDKIENDEHTLDKTVNVEETEVCKSIEPKDQDNTLNTGRSYQSEDIPSVSQHAINVDNNSNNRPVYTNNNKDITEKLSASSTLENLPKKRAPQELGIFTTEAKGDWASDKKEAYLVPLYELKWQRCERVYDISDFACATEASITLRRAMKYIVGSGVPQDSMRAFDLFKRAVNENNHDSIALHCVGLCYQYGIGTTSSYIKAKEYYEQAFDLGNIASGINLAWCRYNNNERITESISFLKEARSNGYVEASYILGLISEDYQKNEDAFEYYSEAADMGHAKAQNSLGYLYAIGRGVEKDIDLANRWFELSGSAGFLGAKYNQTLLMWSNLNSAYKPNIHSVIAIADSLNGIKDQSINDIFHYMPTSYAYFYNLGILHKRAGSSEDIVQFWLKEADKHGIGFYGEYMAHYIKESKKRKIQNTVFNAINSTLKAFNDL